jgi:hypothetical protein
MSSKKSTERKRLISEVSNFGYPVEYSCEGCFRYQELCVMAPDRSLRCAECIKQGRKCTSLSWEALDRTREETQKKIDADEAILEEVMARLLRNKKIMRQADSRAKVKASHLDAELSAEDEALAAADLADCPAASVGVTVSPTIWGTYGLIEDAMRVGESSVPSAGSPSTAVGNSSGS